jgi:hypothetical protein
MFKAFAIALALSVCGFEMALACSGTTVRLKGEEMEPGVFRVLQTTGFFELPGMPDEYDSIGVSKMSDFKAYYQGLVADNDLVFIARIDSAIAPGPAVTSSWDTIVPGLVPDIVLAPSHSGSMLAFYAHLMIDTVLKGSLPSKQFWVKGYSTVNSCGINPSIAARGSSFLNFSDRLDSTQHLKVTMDGGFCVNCPSSHWFDGRYLRSPLFPVLGMDIREVFPSYPVALRGSRPDIRVPLRGPEKAYRLDGRVVPEADRGKSPVPLLK